MLIPTENLIPPPEETKLLRLNCLPSNRIFTKFTAEKLLKVYIDIFIFVKQSQNKKRNGSRNYGIKKKFFFINHQTEYFNINSVILREFF
jgi:hypothetical protein